MKYKLTAIIILIVAICLVTFKFNNKKVELPLINKVFPEKIGDWQGQDITAANNVYKMIPKDQLLFRKYKNSKNNDTLSLSIVLTNERETIHDPQICYRGQGIEMTKQKVMSLSQKHNVHYVYGLKQEKPYTIVYWYTDLNKTFPDRVSFMKDITLSKFWDKSSKGFGLVIIMAPNSMEKDVLKFSEDTNKILLDIGK